MLSDGLAINWVSTVSFDSECFHSVCLDHFHGGVECGYRLATYSGELAF